MHLNRAMRIGPWSVLEVQQLLRRFGTASRDIPSVMAVFGVDEQEAHRMLNQLYLAGYVERNPVGAEELCWRRTPAGEEVAQACFGPPLSRARAERLLQGVLRRVAAINRKPHFLCRVTAVGVCGNYLTEAPVIDALELAVRIVPKPPAAGTADAVFRPDRRLPYWRLQRLLPPHEWPQWRERHVELYLIGGQQRLILHRFDDRLLRRQSVQLVFLALSDGSAAGTRSGSSAD
jgi:hypothetical protein